MLVRTSTFALLLVIGTGLHLGEANDVPASARGLVTTNDRGVANQMLSIIRICCSVGSLFTVVGPVIIRLLIIVWLLSDAIFQTGRDCILIAVICCLAIIFVSIIGFVIATVDNFVAIVLVKLFYVW